MGRTIWSSRHGHMSHGGGWRAPDAGPDPRPTVEGHTMRTLCADLLPVWKTVAPQVSRRTVASPVIPLPPLTPASRASVTTATSRSSTTSIGVARRHLPEQKRSANPTCSIVGQTLAASRACTDRFRGFSSVGRSLACQHGEDRQAAEGTGRHPLVIGFLSDRFLRPLGTNSRLGAVAGPIEPMEVTYHGIPEIC
jgi:hypothetical protein